MSDPKHEQLRNLPSISELLKSQTVRDWLKQYPLPLVTDCLRLAVGELRDRIRGGADADLAPALAGAEEVLRRASELLRHAAEPRVREVINATGIILHTGLGRAVYPECVVDALVGALKGYVNLAIDRETGQRIERDELIEPVLRELTGAEAATVVNNNAGATLLVLAALAAGREVIVSRGQLIEIGGSFRLPEVMAQSGARLVEVGTTNRTHLKDYRNAITLNTAAIMRVHPSNYRIIGFTSEVELAELVELAHAHGLIVIDDLGAGALVDLRRFGLPREPTAGESIATGADIVLFSADKLIGASQGGIILGRKELVAKIRRHPLMRALRVDKTCIMVLERTLHLFRDPDRLARVHPTYRMITTPVEELLARANALVEAIREKAPRVNVTVCESTAYVGSGSVPAEAIPSIAVRISVSGLGATELARRLRLDPAAVFGRIESEHVLLDMRTVRPDQLQTIAEAVARVTEQG